MILFINEKKESKEIDEETVKLICDSMPIRQSVGRFVGTDSKGRTVIIQNTDAFDWCNR